MGCLFLWFLLPSWCSKILFVCVGVFCRIFFTIWLKVCCPVTNSLVFLIWECLISLLFLEDNSARYKIHSYSSFLLALEKHCATSFLSPWFYMIILQLSFWDSVNMNSRYFSYCLLGSLDPSGSVHFFSVYISWIRFVVLICPQFYWFYPI